MKPLLLRTSHPQTFLAYRYAIIGVSVVLYLLGWVGLLALASHILKNQWREAVPFTIELKEGIAQSQAFQFQQKLEGSEFVKLGTVQYVSKEEGLKALQADLGRDSLLLFGENPLPDMLQFQLKGNYFGSVTNIVDSLQKQTEVSYIFYDESLIQTAIQLGYWSWGLLFLALACVVVAVLFIRYALHWVLWANRSIIQVMQLAGADQQTIYYPYRHQGIINGLWSGGLAAAAILLTAFAVNALWGQALSWWLWWQFWFLLLLLPALGVLLWRLATRRIHLSEYQD